MKLTFIRHGETDHNTKDIIQGHTETEINENGKRQADDTGKLAAEKMLTDKKTGQKTFSRIICSPRLRAQQTAKIINTYLNLPIEIWDEVGEIDFGSFANKSWTQVAEEANNPNIKTEFRNMNFDLTPFQGESKTQVQSRLQRAIEKLYHEHPNEHIIIVTHAPIIRMTFHLLKNESPFMIENAHMYEFEI